MFASLRPRNALLGVAIVTIGLLAGFRWASRPWSSNPSRWARFGSSSVVSRRCGRNIRTRRSRSTDCSRAGIVRPASMSFGSRRRCPSSKAGSVGRSRPSSSPRIRARDRSCSASATIFPAAACSSEDTVYAAGYVPHAVETALIIGLGGAPDVLTALHHGVRTIDAVDINRTTIDIVRNEFGAFLGHPYDRPEVTTHQVDGRTFLRRDEPCLRPHRDERRRHEIDVRGGNARGQQKRTSTRARRCETCWRDYARTAS